MLATKHIVVLSPLRTGSTWVYEVLTHCLEPSTKGYVENVDNVASLIASTNGYGVFKSHNPEFSTTSELNIFIIRVLRNIYDSLISRALYCRNVRRKEGLANDPAEEQAIDSCLGLPDRAFLNRFLKECPKVDDWISDYLAIKTMDGAHYTLYYEMLLHDSFTQLSHCLDAIGVPKLKNDVIEKALDNCSLERIATRNTPGFVATTGVGAWMMLLDEDTISRIKVALCS